MKSLVQVIWFSLVFTLVHFLLDILFRSHDSIEENGIRSVVWGGIMGITMHYISERKKH
jgi:hypothetical protein